MQLARKTFTVEERFVENELTRYSGPHVYQQEDAIKPDGTPSRTAQNTILHTLWPNYAGLWLQVHQQSGCKSSWLTRFNTTDRGTVECTSI